MLEIKVPTYDKLMNPTVEALFILGGSGTIEEINAKAVEIAGLSTEQLEVLHNPDKGSQSEIEYRLAWARTYLKKFGVLENSDRGIWSLTPYGRQIKRVNPQEVKQFVRDKRRKAKVDEQENPDEDIEISWREELLQVILQMSPSSFERLIQRLLRESGFTQVEVTGKSGDGGVDGKGIMRIGGLLSFRVIFQCKRYQGSVGSGQIRDFRGAMIGRADKGLLVTTGTFTIDAYKEATRDGAPAIDLIDGNQLVHMLKELKLGVKTETIQVERVSVNHEWFGNI